MEPKLYDKLPEGTKVKKTWNGVTTRGTIAKQWTRHGSKAYLESFFLPEGKKRPLDIHVSLIELDNS